MLSIIISSYQSAYFSSLQENVIATIGVPYEIIKVDNPGLMGICEAYNLGAEKANFDYLLFLHEDTEFVTTNWGEKLLPLLVDEKNGVIGLAGSTYVPNVPFAWWDKYENTIMNIQQFNKKSEIRNYSITENKEAIVLDGVFLACRRIVWQEFKFNPDIKSFHAYDLDFSVRVSKKYNNIILHSIKLKHFSEGNPDNEWWNSILESRKFFTAPSKQQTNKKTELFFYKKLEERLIEFNISGKKSILLKYNSPFYIGFKFSLKNFFVQLLK